MLIFRRNFSCPKTNISRGVIIISGLELMPIIVIILIVLFIDIILSAIYKNEPKIDKGLAIPYHKLTYRRKMIRALWTAPFVIVCLIIIYQIGEWSRNVYIVFAIICAAGYIFQFLYNFIKWKKYEQHPFKE